MLHLDNRSKNFHNTASKHINQYTLASKQSIDGNPSAEKERVSELSKRVSIGQNNTVNISRWSADTSSTFWPGQTISIMEDEHPAGTSPEIYVKVYLKPGGSWNFHSVMSIDLRSDHAAIITSTGLEAQLEAGCSIFPNSSHPETMAIKRKNAPPRFHSPTTSNLLLLRGILVDIIPPFVF